MRFISVRDIRSKGRQLWQSLEKEKELVVTSNGKPIALLTGVNENNFEEVLRDLRRTRALRAAEDMQRASARAGLDKMADEEIEEEIRETRRDRNS